MRGMLESSHTELYSMGFGWIYSSQRNPDKNKQLKHLIYETEQVTDDFLPYMYM